LVIVATTGYAGPLPILDQLNISRIVHVSLPHTVLCRQLLSRVNSGDTSG
jgi:hypothetical protein